MEFTVIPTIRLIPLVCVEKPGQALLAWQEFQVVDRMEEAVVFLLGIWVIIRHLVYMPQLQLFWAQKSLQLRLWE
jgi:hypothetical protein